MVEKIDRRRFLKIVGPAVVGGLLARGSIRKQELIYVPFNEAELSEEKSLPEQIDDKDKLPVWEKGDRPKFLMIPKIDFRSNVQISKFIKKDENHLSYEVPTSGIATPQEQMPGLIFIFGHSRWNRVMQDFSRIEDLELGDIVAIVNQREQPFFFKVSNFRLVNPDETVLIPKESLLLTLQTTAVDAVTGNLSDDWILSIDKVLAKVGTNRPVDLDQSLVFMIDANPTKLT